MMSSKPFEDRKNQFKNRGQMQPNEIRRRRDDFTVEIRKQKREDSLAKRRNFDPTSAKAADQDFSDDSDQEFGGDQSSVLKTELDSLTVQLNSSDPEAQMQATAKFRKILSKGYYFN